MTAQAIAGRLRDARLYVGMSATEVEAATGISEVDIAAIEDGVRAADDLELRRLARLYGYASAYFFGHDDPLPDESLTILTRLTSELTEHDRQQALRFAAYLRQVPGD